MVAHFTTRDCNPRAIAERTQIMVAESVTEQVKAAIPPTFREQPVAKPVPVIVVNLPAVLIGASTLMRTALVPMAAGKTQDQSGRGKKAT